jgi:manganese-dependent inorganic pyrophosphatase
MPVFVIGHKNPDTDAICSAIGYAHFLKLTSFPEAEAACCGEINARTQFALGAAGVEQPRLLMDVRPTLGQIARRDVVTAREDEALFTVYRRMLKKQIRAMPVLARDGSLKGLISFARLMELVLPDRDIDVGARQIETSLQRLAGVLDATVLHSVEADRDEELIVTVAAMSAGGFVQRMKQFPASRVMVVTGDRPTIQKPAIEYGVRALVITGGYQLPGDLLELARRRKVSVLLSPHDTATTTLLIRSAKIIAAAVSSEFLKFSESAPVEKIAKELAGAAQDVYPVMDERGAMTGVFAKSDLVNPKRTRLVLVDHNELAQAVTGADQAEILEVIDHHRLGGGVMSREPIRFINEPVGSTCTIVTKFLRHREWVPPRNIGICLAAGMISDTLNLTSPTTTDTDRDMLAWLAGACEIDVPRFAESFFAAGSVLEAYAPDEAVNIDCKDYREAGWQFAVAQIEELGLSQFDSKKDDLRAALRRMVADRKLDFVSLMITDITTHFSLLMVEGDERVRGAIDYPVREAGLFEMDGVVSRKKQLLPHLARLLAHVEK